MTDRELLEMAAKAVGINLHVWGTKGAENFADMDVTPCGKLWNPLTNDGDALRLAVALGLRIEHDWFGTNGYDQKLGGRVRVRARGAASELGWFKEHLDVAAFSATCRAIVRCAAAIGEQMP